MQYMFFTPAGLACKECGTGLVPHRWKQHFTNKHPHLHFNQAASGFEQKLVTHVEATISDHNRVQYAKESTIFVKDFCSVCCKIFSDARSYGKHATNESYQCSREDHKSIECYLMKCGRFYPITGALSKNVATDIATAVTPGNKSDSSPGRNQSSTPNLPTPTNLSAKLGEIAGAGGAAGVPDAVGQSLKWQDTTADDPYMNLFGELPLSNRNMNTKVDGILEKLIRKDDRISEWRKVLHKRIATSDDFISQMKSDIECFRDPSDTLNKNFGLSKLMDAFVMLEDNFHSILHGSRGNIRTALVKFKQDDDADMDTPAKWGFRPRSEKSTEQKEEFRALLKYLHDQGCPFMDTYMQVMSETTYSVSQAHDHGLVAKLIYQLAVEQIPDGDYIPWICRFAQSRCFQIKQGEVKLRSMKQCGSLFSTILYIIREGVLACAAMMEQKGYGHKAEEMISFVQKSAVSNILAPWISACRSKTNIEAGEKTSLVTEEGDIVCNNAIFKKEDYSRLIPKVDSALRLLFRDAFEGDEWMNFFKDGTIHVSYQ